MRGFAFAVLLLSSASASAAPYDVTGVEWGDVLNVRQSANPKAAIVGAIPYDGAQIEIEGKPANGWVKVTYRNTTGFVLAKFLRPSVAAGPLPTTLKCGGSEPFWSAEFGPKGATFEHMTDGKTKIDIGPFQKTSNRDNSWMAMGPKSAASLTRERCTEGMADDNFPYTLHMSTPASGIVRGCCR